MTSCMLTLAAGWNINMTSCMLTLAACWSSNMTSCMLTLAAGWSSNMTSCMLTLGNQILKVDLKRVEKWSLVMVFRTFLGQERGGHFGEVPKTKL